MKRRILLYRLISAAILTAAAVRLAETADFGRVQQISASEGGASLSRGASSLAADNEGQFHLAYIAKESDQFLVRYTQRPNAQEGWQAPTTIRFDPRPAGHPSTTVLPDGTRFIAWHDYQHSTPEGNYIDNIEIYIASAPPGRDFSQPIRVTSTAAGHMGDNGYMPYLAASTDGNYLALVWYDFFYNGHISDLFCIVAPPSTFFSLLPTDLDTARLTDLADRSGPVPFIFPEAVTDKDGTVHVVFTSGFSERAGNLYYLRRERDGAVSPVTILAENASSYFSPPRLARSRDGDIWVCYCDRSQDPAHRQVKLSRLTLGPPALADTITITSPDTDCTNPDLAIGPDGLVHIVWQEIIPTGFWDIHSDIFYGSVDTKERVVSSPLRLNDPENEAELPTIAVTPQGSICVAWEQLGQETVNVRQIIVRTADAEASIQEWMLR